MAHESKEKELRIIAELTESEQKRLRKIILGHGNLKKAWLKSAIKNRRTIERIALTGKGMQENIQKIRINLLANANIQNVSNNQN